MRVSSQIAWLYAICSWTSRADARDDARDACGELLYRRVVHEVTSSPVPTASVQQLEQEIIVLNKAIDDLVTLLNDARASISNVISLLSTTASTTVITETR